MAQPTITPAFPEFLPPWVARQPWYRGTGVPSLALAGAFRLEDPAGEVGMETHLLSDGTVIYQVPMTYRGAPLPGAGPAALIVTAEHSELGTRWIYDAEADPVWRDELVRFARNGAAADLRTRSGVVAAAVRGRPVSAAKLRGDGLAIELQRVLTPAEPAADACTAGLVTGSWHLAGRGAEAVTGCLAIIRLAVRVRCASP